MTVNCQVNWEGCASAALGGTSVCSQGYWCANQSQAGLGFIKQSSLTVQHSRPYLQKELGISSFSGQFATGSGAVGMALATQGLGGFRQSSLWLSSGLKLHPLISAGAGLHLWNSSLENDFFHTPGLGFALALQIRISKQWTAGARVLHPAVWTSNRGRLGKHAMLIECGISFSFFDTGCITTDIHVKPGEGIILCNGLEWTLNSRSQLRCGFFSHPFSFTSGISLEFEYWIAEFSFQYRTDSGISPQTSLSHAW